MITIMVANQKGGVGKTTTVLELCNLLGSNYHVLGIDFDQQRNFSKYSGAVIENVPTIYEVLTAKCLLSNAVQHLDKYDILVSSKQLSNTKEFSELDDMWLLKDALEDAAYDFCIIDNAPARGTLLNMSYLASDYCIIITECDDGSLDGIEEIADDIRVFKKRGNLTEVEILGIVLNKTERTTLHSVVYDELAETAKGIGTELFKTVIRKSIAVSESKRARKSLQDYDPENHTGLDYRDLTNEVIERIRIAGRMTKEKGDSK